MVSRSPPWPTEAGVSQFAGAFCPFRLTCYLLSREIMLDVDAVALGDRRQGLAGCTALDGLGPMVIGLLALATELDAFRHRALAVFTGALPDQLTLELGNAGQQRREKSALRSPGFSVFISFASCGKTCCRIGRHALRSLFAPSSN